MADSNISMTLLTNMSNLTQNMSNLTQNISNLTQTFDMSNCFIAADKDGLLTQRLCFNTTTNMWVQTAISSESISAFASASDQAVLFGDLDTMWVLLAGILVFFMQAGFSMLEAGAVSDKNVVNILFKNVMDATIAAIIFAAVGYGFAYGHPNGSDNLFIGLGNWFLLDEDGSTFGSFFFQWTFAATATTIVSGSVAERCKIDAYFIYSIILTGFIYPVVVHWVWDADGWLCAWQNDANPRSPLLSLTWSGDGGSNGMLDFAGCSVVHMVGGFAGLVGAILLGPRKGRFESSAEGEGMSSPHMPHNLLLSSLGTLILWMGWYGFNAGSTLMVSGGMSAVASRCAVTTTIAASAAAMAATLYGRIVNKTYDISNTMNGVLAGLVSITAGCAYMNVWGSLATGIIGTIVYKLSSAFLIKMKIDDPLDAAPVHGFCGLWGALAVGIFGTDANVKAVLGYENDAIATGRQFACQVIGCLAILAWTLITSFLLFAMTKYTIGLRVEESVEELGLDEAEHGRKAYSFGGMLSMSKKIAAVYTKALGSPRSAERRSAEKGSLSFGSVDEPNKRSSRFKVFKNAEKNGNEKSSRSERASNEGTPSLAMLKEV